MPNLSEFFFLILVLVITICVVLGSWSLYSIAMNLDILVRGTESPPSPPETPVQEPEPPAKLDPVPETQSPTVEGPVQESDLSGNPEELPIVVPHSTGSRGSSTSVLD